MASLTFGRKLYSEVFTRSFRNGKRSPKRQLCSMPSAVKNKPTETSMHRENLASNLKPHSALNSFNWLSQFGPKFLINGDRVQVMTEPDQFYQVLKLKTRKAKRRITLASLYLGNGHLEQDLVSCIHEACEGALSSGNTDFEVNVLLDYTRGSRGKSNSRTMLQPLMTDHKCVNVSLFHTPDLRGILKKLVPERFNETLGLTHLKVYLFDDSLIISGANLSNDYFVNRQDRYILFNDCPELADYFNDLVKSIMSFSLSLSANDSLELAKDWKYHPFEDGDNGENFKVAAKTKIERCLRLGESIKDVYKREERGEKGNQSLETHDLHDPLADTAVYPLVQMGPFDVTYDEQAMLHLLESSQPEDNILLASGYFNLTEQYMSSIVEQSSAKYSILMASPQANGFLGAKGLAGSIPYSYIYLAHQFLQKVTSRRQQSRICLKEYARDNWTFHGKGIWYYLAGHSLPSLILVGSPNFGYRSVYKDLECEVAIVTENQNLQKQLKEEHVHMYSTSSPVTESTFLQQDRHVPIWTKMVTNVIKKYF